MSPGTTSLLLDAAILFKSGEFFFRTPVKMFQQDFNLQLKLDSTQRKLYSGCIHKNVTSIFKHKSEEGRRLQRWTSGVLLIRRDRWTGGGEMGTQTHKKTCLKAVCLVAELQPTLEPDGVTVERPKERRINLNNVTTWEEFSKWMG